MPRLRESGAIALLLAFAPACWAEATPGKRFIDSDRGELINALPELASLEFDDNQTNLPELLQGLGKIYQQTLDKFVSVSIADEGRELRFSKDTLMWVERRQTFRYHMATRPNSEVRRPVNDFLGFGSFLDFLDDFTPVGQQQMRFKLLGHTQELTRRAVVLAFIRKDEQRQGFVWVDEKTKHILRLRIDFLKPPEGTTVKSLSLDLRLITVNFPAYDAALWLPLHAVIHATFPNSEAHGVFRFGDYHVEGFEKDDDPDLVKEDTGQPEQHTDAGEDAFERLMDGVLALQADHPDQAITPLREAQAQLPQRIEISYLLAVALHRNGDLEGAERETRTVLQKLPALAGAHNEMGMLLLARNDRAGAVAEFQEAAKLAPDNATVRANLEDVLKAAAPSPSLPSPDSPVTIKVDVRQVLVPVVVTDKEGHLLTDLKQSDFHVFEDGVEQKIVAFGSERSDLTTHTTADASTQEVPAMSPNRDEPTRIIGPHAYIICVDAFHSSFGNFVQVRKALEQLFQEEKPGTSQYAIVSLGETMRVLQNTTKDPAQVLQTLGSSEFRTRIGESQVSSEKHDLERFEAQLRDAFETCGASVLNSPPSKATAQNPQAILCTAKKSPLPLEANLIAEHSKLMLQQFLTQLKSVVQQLAAGKGRRTLILISDGFLTSPGRPPFELLASYFPGFSALPGLDRASEQLETIFQLAAKGNVPIYTIDSRGLYTPAGFDASQPGGSPPAIAPKVLQASGNWQTDQGATLAEIAAATGGTAFRNSNDLLAGLKRAFADGREYYLLAYTPANTKQDGKFRRIEVQVTKKQATVTAKRGYWASPQ